MNNFTSIIIGIAIFYLFILCYVCISGHFNRRRDRKILRDSPYCNVKHIVNTEYELPEEGNVYGDVCKVLEPYTIYKVKSALQEALMVNVNLGKVTKLFLENTTTKKEKVGIINRFNEAKTIDQSNALYESIKRELKNAKQYVWCEGDEWRKLN